jgi:Ca2+-binding EF-hand superfamily protein
MSKDQSGTLEAQELKKYFNHWGIHVSDQAFSKIFEELDHDNDGVISY